MLIIYKFCTQDKVFWVVQHKHGLDANNGLSSGQRWMKHRGAIYGGGLYRQINGWIDQLEMLLSHLAIAPQARSEPVRSVPA